MTRFQPSASSSAASSAERRLTLVRSMGMAARRQSDSVGLPPPVEEVVGRRRHHRAVAEAQGQAATAAAAVSTWLAWLAAKMTGASSPVERLVAPDQRGGDDPGQRAGHVVEQHGPGQPRPGTGGPRRCRSRRRARARAAAGAPTRASWARPAGSRRRPTRRPVTTGERPPDGRRADPSPCPVPSRASVRTDRRVRSEFDGPIRGCHCTSAIRSGGVCRWVIDG